MKKKIISLIFVCLLGAQSALQAESWLSMASNWFCAQRPLVQHGIVIAIGAAVGTLIGHVLFKKRSVKKRPAAGDEGVAASIARAPMRRDVAAPNNLQQRALTAYAKMHSEWNSFEPHTIYEQTNVLLKGRAIAHSALNTLGKLGIQSALKDKIQRLVTCIVDTRWQDYVDQPRVRQQFKQNVSDLIMALAEVHRTYTTQLRPGTVHIAATR